MNELVLTEANVPPSDLELPAHTEIRQKRVHKEQPLPVLVCS